MFRELGWGLRRGKQRVDDVMHQIFKEPDPHLPAAEQSASPDSDPGAYCSVAQPAGLVSSPGAQVLLLEAGTEAKQRGWWPAGDPSRSPVLPVKNCRSMAQ